MSPDVAVMSKFTVTVGKVVVADGRNVTIPVPVYDQWYSSVFGSAITEMTTPVAPAHKDGASTEYTRVCGLRHSLIAG